MAQPDVPRPPFDKVYAGVVTRWLLGEARSASDPRELLAGYAAALRADGIAVDRIFVVTPTLHPQVAALNFIWRSDRDEVVIVERRWREQGQAEFQDSPLRPILQGSAETFRRHLADPSVPRDFGVVRELADAGFTDYLVAGITPSQAVPGARIPLPSGAAPTEQLSRRAVVSWSTRAPGGLSDDAVERCLASLNLLAPLLDTHMARHIAARLLAVYIGDDAGGRVLSGAFRRGDGGSVRAAVCFTDLRDFTTLSDALPREQLLELLDSYFDCVVGAVAAHGGEVLKFIGDAVLAIFRVEGADDARACNAALAAGRDAFARAVAANAARAGRTPIDFGMSIHIGEVVYGNIGGVERLDFTVIGPAVNLASRIQGLCRGLGRSLLVSEPVARLTGADCEDLGPRALKGVSAEVRVFAPR